jgi:TRAP transporter TAXI family solute receptor
MPGSGFHALGTALGHAYAEVVPAVSGQVVESPGAVRNLEALQAGDAEIGFAFADVTYLSYMGAAQPGAPPFDRLRAIAVLQMTPLYVIAGPRSPVRTITDLRGRRIGMGPSGSGTAVTSAIVLGAFGMDLSDVTAENLPFSEAAERLVAGTLDAAFVNASYSAESVTLATRAGGTLLAVDGPAVEDLRSDYPFLRPTFIPGGTYANHPAAVRTVGIDTLVLCRADMGGDLVYALTKALFEILPKTAPVHVPLDRMDMAQAPATPIPLHPGAARYYRERELSR